MWIFAFVLIRKQNKRALISSYLWANVRPLMGQRSSSSTLIIIVNVCCHSHESWIVEIGQHSVHYARSQQQQQIKRYKIPVRINIHSIQKLLIVLHARFHSIQTMMCLWDSFNSFFSSYKTTERRNSACFFFATSTSSLVFALPDWSNNEWWKKVNRINSVLKSYILKSNTNHIVFSVNL